MLTKEHLVNFDVQENTPKVRFLASLSNGQTVIQDDRDRSYQHAWIRLQEFLQSNPGLHITGLRLQSGEKEFKMPSSQKGYFFSKAHKAVWPSTNQISVVGCGFYDGDSVYIRWGSYPSLDQEYTETRTKEKAGMFLITNNE